jgi:hypothetical protein
MTYAKEMKKLTQKMNSEMSRRIRFEEKCFIHTSPQILN